MSYRVSIPKVKSQREEMFSNLVRIGKSRRNPQAIQWWLSHWYMRGIRNFGTLNYQNGTVQISYTDTSGVLKFKYEEIVSKYQAQLGRLMGINLSPVVKRKGISLDGLRKSSIAQTALSAAFPQAKVNKLKVDICPPLITYGTIGLGLWVEDEDSMGIDIIMPWEILPIPTDISNPTEARGLIRRRFVPVDWVKNLLITPDNKSQIYKDMDVARIMAGDLPAEVYSKFQGQTTGLTTSGDGYYIHDKTKQKNYIGSGKKESKDKTRIDITELVEVWTETSDGYLAEYLIYAGGQELYTKDLSQARKQMPIQILRDITVGGFWGRSFVEIQMPMNTEIEYSLGSTFQAINEFDLYGLQMWPTTAGVNPVAERGTDGIKRVRYETDYSVPDQKPFNIMPAKMSPFHVKAIEMGVALGDKIAGQPQEMMQGGAPGRVDSSSGLGLLYEISGVPLSPTAKGIAIGVSGMYRAMLGEIKATWGNEKVVSVSHLDDALAGIKFDAETGEMSLAENAIPFPDEVEITVASEVPISKEQQKIDVKEALEKGIITLDEYNIKVRTDDLDLPVGNEVAWQNYRRAKYENLVLFGDGKQPGKIIMAPWDLHPIHLTTLDAFMARPEFFLADTPVREAFIAHRDEHYAGMGQLPEGMETPEEAAEMEMGMEAGEGTLQGGGPM